MTDTMAETVRRTAHLARLALPEAELARHVPQFERILEAFQVLAQFEGAAAIGAEPAPLARVHPDEPRPSLSPARALAGAPEVVEGFFAVPKTVGGER